MKKTEKEMTMEEKTTPYAREREIMSRAVREIYREEFRAADAGAFDKAMFDVVTVNDLKIEERLINVIRSEFPGDRILSEETNADTLPGGRMWTVDPIDGTYNMCRGVPIYGIQCALYEGEETVFSLILLPETDEAFTAEKGCGAFRNGVPISVERRDPEHAVVSFGDYSHRSADDRRLQHQIMGRVAERVAKVRMYGAASVDFAYLASGRIDGTLLFTRNRWDIAPGMLLAKEAGAFIGSVRDGITPRYEAEAGSAAAAATEELFRLLTGRDLSADSETVGKNEI